MLVMRLWLRTGIQIISSSGNQPGGCRAGLHHVRTTRNRLFTVGGVGRVETGGFRPALHPRFVKSPLSAAGSGRNRPGGDRRLEAPTHKSQPLDGICTVTCVR
jgi:hypothetical protein